MIEGGGKIVENLIFNDDVDIGIIILFVDYIEFYLIFLYNEELLLVVSNDYYLVYLNKVDMVDLKDEEFVLFYDDYYLKD